MDFNLTIAVVALPLFMFLFLGLAGVKMGRKLTGVLGVIGQGVTTVLAYGLALTYFFGTGQGQIVDGVRQTIIVADWSWLNLGDKVMANIGFELDPIAAMMLIVITTISFFVHLYSLGYMSDHDGNAEKGFQRYYAFLALFTFSMLGMVVATNIFQIFVFFEMVGVSSYLLIGFYYSSPAAIHASKKAFIVTRLADFFFLFGVIVLGFAVSTLTNLVPEGGSALNFSTLLSNPEAIASQLGAVEFFGIPALPLSLICIFIGGAGKSAMYPLHIWLPDAMERPNPSVSVDSRCYHGCGRCVLGGSSVPTLCDLRRGYQRGGSDWCFHSILRCCSGLRAERHQACPRILHTLSNCLHDDSPRCEHRGWRRRRRRSWLHGFNVPPLHSRNVQGIALPRCRCSDSRCSQQ